MVMAKEEGLDRFLHYDWHRRASLVDHILDTGATLEEFYRCECIEPGDFVIEPYAAEMEKGKRRVDLLLRRDGHFRKGDGVLPLSIVKRVSVGEGAAEFTVDYELRGEVDVPFLLGVEFNFAFLGSGGDRYLETERGRYPLTLQEVLSPASNLRFHDPYQDIEVFLELGEATEIWTFPVEVVSLSENGFERNYQSTMVMPVWHMDLAGGSRSISLKVRMDKARQA
jgi:alpha-amylase